MTRLEALLSCAAGDSVAHIPAATELPVDDEGPLDAELVVVGESLGQEERDKRRNFIGRSGKKLRHHARLAGVNLDKARICNVYPLYPPGGSISNVPQGDVVRWQNDVRRRVRDCYRRKLIVAVGNIALEAFTGFRDITRRRGSVYTWEGVPVLAMIHPAMVLRRKQYEKHCRLDWERAKKLLTPHDIHDYSCGCARIRRRNHITPFNTRPNDLEDAIQAYMWHARDTENIMAVDIETPKMKGGQRQIVCVSFACTPEESLVLPWDTYKQAITHLCESPCIKLGHGLISFDRWWLRHEGIELQGAIRDTLAMHHCLDPASEHKLQFLISRYLWVPYYKDEGKGHDFTVIEKDLPAYFEYCGMDSCCTRELHDLFWVQLCARGMMEFYQRHYEPIFDPMLDVSSRGVRVDHAARLRILAEWLRIAREARDELGALVGHPLFKPGKNDETKTISGAMLKDLLYRELHIPVHTKRRQTGEETETSDQVTLRKIKKEHSNNPRVVQVVDLAMRHNRYQKLASFCYDSHFDVDGRFPFTLKINTEAARLASSTAPHGRGSNSQNHPRDKRFRAIFLPEPGEVLLSFDLSQVESRICFIRTGDPELIRLGRLRASQFDQHRYMGSIMFVKSAEDIDDDERQVSKSGSHAIQRDMQAATMVDTLLKHGYERTEEECQVYIDRYHAAFPAIRLWHQRIRKEIRAYRRLVNRWGRVWDVRYEEVNDELYRRGYSWLLQSDCADLMNQCCFIPLWNWLKDDLNCLHSRILFHEHDELVCSCPVDEVYDVAIFVREHLEVELDYDGVGLSVPVEFSMGRNYAKQIGWKELPPRTELERTAKELV